jgi:hypothetical protein
VRLSIKITILVVDRVPIIGVASLGVVPDAWLSKALTLILHHQIKVIGNNLVIIEIKRPEQTARVVGGKSARIVRRGDDRREEGEDDQDPHISTLKNVVCTHKLTVVVLWVCVL